ncbi:hypothetical protein, partial [Escherichia coli]|uniref:hypothetical protein n=1 Tax=Escherichia coli TaxID=562 RepID=UPI001FA95F30
TYPGQAGKPGTRSVALESCSDFSVNINTVLASRLLLNNSLVHGIFLPGPKFNEHNDGPVCAGLNDCA